MPTAKEMFESLGYPIEEACLPLGIYKHIISYGTRENGYIHFDIDNKTLNCFTGITPKLHQAIHQQMIELGWIEDRDTPMKIKEIHVDEYFCPNCGAENMADQRKVEDKYCPVCGQKLRCEDE